MQLINLNRFLIKIIKRQLSGETRQIDFAIIKY